MEVKTYIVILAAGFGTRFGGEIRKQFLMFHGKELWRHLFDTACSILPKEQIVVVGIDIPGGETRSESVKKGLDWVYHHNDCKRVIICEAARSLVTKEQLKAIIELQSRSCCFVIPVVDTVILTDKTYLTRSDCRHLLSPQGFDFDMLYQAYSNCDLSEIRTDETRLMFDVYGIKPDFLEGGDNLYKVTYPKDLAVLENIYRTLLENEKN